MHYFRLQTASVRAIRRSGIFHRQAVDGKRDPLWMVVVMVVVVV